MAKISAVIITKNEERFIGRCLESLKEVADEIIVVDSFSTDSTEEICSGYNVKFSKHPFGGYVEQKNYALSLASFPYVLSLDADEALSDELKKSILAVKDNLQADGYYLNRISNYCGKWLKHSRLFPERRMRLFNPAKGKWVGPNPHDLFILHQGGTEKILKGHLYHWNYDSFEDHSEKMNRFSSIGAKEYFDSGRRAGPFAAFFHMLWSFFRSYVLKAGFIDGHLGFVNCSIIAYASFLKHAKLRHLNMIEKK